MKKILLYLTAAALLQTSCSDENTILHNSSVIKLDVEISASYDNGINSRVISKENNQAEIGETAINYYWQLGDVISVYTSSGAVAAASNFNIKRGSLTTDASSAVFQGVIDAMPGTELPIYAIYPSPSVNINPKSFVKSIIAQTYDGKLDNACSCLTAVSEFQYPVITESLKFKQQMAILNFNLKLPENDTITQDVVVMSLQSPELYNKMSIDFTTQKAAFSNGSGDNIDVVMPNSRGKSSLNVKAYVYPNTIKNLNITVKDKTDKGVRFYIASLVGEKDVENGQMYNVTSNLTLKELQPGDDEEVPIEISTKEQLMEIANNVNNALDDYKGKYIRLMNDIDLSGEIWSPIGNNGDHKFKGFFNGNGKTISGMNVQGMNYVGLFGNVYGGYIKDLTVKGNAISIAPGTTPTYIAGIAGAISGGCELEGKLISEVNISYNAETVHTLFVGGLFGCVLPNENGYKIVDGTQFIYGADDGTTAGIDVTNLSEMAVGGIFGRINAGSWEGTATFTNYSQKISAIAKLTLKKNFAVGGLVGYLTNIPLASFEGHNFGKEVYGEIIPQATFTGGQAAVGGLLGFSNAKNGFMVRDVNDDIIIKSISSGDFYNSCTVWVGRATGAQGLNTGNTQNANKVDGAEMTRENSFAIGGSARYINGVKQN